jgi:hypothetical protein
MGLPGYLASVIFFDSESDAIADPLLASSLMN